jgi:SAM-dependent methyltransferase
MSFQLRSGKAETNRADDYCMMATVTKTVASGRFDKRQFSDIEANAIARIAEEQDWRVAAHDYMRSTNHRAYRLAIDEYRSQLRFLLPLTAESRVLNLRSDWGSVAFNLATHVGFVVAMDDRLTRARFVCARQKQMGVQPLHTICASALPALPFGEQTFDAVIMAEAMEDIGGFRQASWSGSFGAKLGEVKRVLRAGGWILLGVANALGIGRPGTGPTGCVRTYWGYRRALRRAGFARIQFYASLPSHQEPFFILPLDGTQALNYFVARVLNAQDYRMKLEERGLGLLYRIIVSLQHVGQQLGAIALARYFVPSYVIIAQR